MTFFYCDSTPDRLTHLSLQEQEAENYRLQRDEKFVAACIAAGKRSGSEAHRLWKKQLINQDSVQASPACP